MLLPPDQKEENFPIHAAGWMLSDWWILLVQYILVMVKVCNRIVWYCKLNLLFSSGVILLAIIISI